MGATLEATPVDEVTRNALQQFFESSSSYLTGESSAGPEHAELATRWSEQRVLDNLISAIAACRDQEAIVLAPTLLSRPAVFVGVLARMIKSERADLIAYVIQAVHRDPSLTTRRYAARTLLHTASAAGCLELVELLLRLGTDPDVRDGGNHTPLYSVANECASETGPAVVRTLVQAGADVNACGGVTRTTALHMAARRGHVEIARALLDCGAVIGARDIKGATPLQRAVNCRRNAVVQLLKSA